MMRKGEISYKSQKQKEKGLSERILELERSEFKPHQLFPYYVIQGNLTPLHLIFLQHDPLAWDCSGIQIFVESDSRKNLVKD